MNPEERRIIGHVGDLNRSYRELFDLVNLPSNDKLTMTEELEENLRRRIWRLRAKVQSLEEYLPSFLRELGQAEPSQELEAAFHELYLNRQQAKGLQLNIAFVAEAIPKNVAHQTSNVRESAWGAANSGHRKRAHQKRLPQRGTQGPTVADKLAHPSEYPTIDVKEAQQVLRVSRSTIYRWVEEGKLQRASLGRESGRRGRMLLLTESVKRMLEVSSE